MQYSLQGLHQYISENATKKYWLSNIYSQKVREAHVKGLIHIHDLGFLSTYCVGWDLYDLLLQGFCGVPGKVTSKPAKHFKSALGQVVNFMFSLQGEAAGAQAFSSWDTLLAPFIRYDALTYTEVKQAVQEWVFNMNVATRAGFQAPFTNITLDLQCPKPYADTQVIIGGLPQKETYKEFQHEMDMLNRAFAEVMMEGDADGRIFSFPIPTYNITEDFNWENPNLAAVWEMTCKYGVPYFANFMNSDLDPDDVRSMCCRLRLDKSQLKHKGGGLFGANPLTGSVGVVTINLPRIAYLSSSETEMKSRIKEAMEIAKESLVVKRKTIEKYTENNLYPYTKHYLKAVKQRTGKYWSNHFSTIGVVGGHEACLNMGIKEGLACREGQALMDDILDFMLEVLNCFKKETGDNYNLEATPAESTAYRLALKDKKEFPDIVASGKEEVYYTNSTQLPVNATEDIFEALNLQDSLQSKYTGGTVFHTYLGERIHDHIILKNLIKKISKNFSLPYFSISPVFSVCKNHGYIPGEEKTCPICERETEIFSRVVGFYRPTNQWNKGKQEEHRQRINFKNK